MAHNKKAKFALDQKLVHINMELENLKETLVKIQNAKDPQWDTTGTAGHILEQLEEINEGLNEIEF